jgi:hypothetical protein
MLRFEYQGQLWDLRIQIEIRSYSCMVRVLERYPKDGGIEIIGALAQELENPIIRIVSIIVTECRLSSLLFISLLN